MKQCCLILHFDTRLCSEEFVVVMHIHDSLAKGFEDFRTFHITVEVMGYYVFCKWKRIENVFYLLTGVSKKCKHAGLEAKILS